MPSLKDHHNQLNAISINLKLIENKFFPHIFQFKIPILSPKLNFKMKRSFNEINHSELIFFNTENVGFNKN